MAVAVAKGLKVKEIYPAELIEILKNSKTSSENTLNSVAEAASREERKRLREDNKLEEKYQKIRGKCVTEAFGTTLKSLREKEELLSKLNKEHQNVIGDSSQSPSALTNELEITKGVYQGAVGTTKRDRKDTAKAGITAAVGIGSAIAGVVSPSLVAKASGIVAFATANPIFGALSISASVASLIHMAYKYAKRKRGNVSDEFAKGDALAKDIEEYLDKVNAFTQTIDADKEMIKGKIKSLSKEEFRTFFKDYLSEKIRSFNLTTEDIKSVEASEVFEEFKVENTNSKNLSGAKNSQAETAALGG